MYKIRMTDSVTIKNFSILKPEVEMEFDDNRLLVGAVQAVQEDLAYVVDCQLRTIAARMTPADKTAVLRDASVDPRFVAILKES
jgi:hypothetical protein